MTDCKIIYSLAAYMKTFKNDMIEIFDSEDEAKQVLENMREFGEYIRGGIRVVDPVMGVEFIADLNIRPVAIEKTLYDQICESGIKVISSESLVPYWGREGLNNPDELKEMPKIIGSYVPWKFYTEDIHLN